MISALLLLYSNLLSLVLAGALAEYHFFENFGDKLHDYSGHAGYATNGKSADQFSFKGAIFTDRGAYFEGPNTAITLPSNNITGNYFLLPQEFSIAFWVNLKGYNEYDKKGYKNTNESLLFIRYLDKDNYFYISATKDNQLKLSINNSTKTYSKNLDKLVPNSWQYIVLTLDNKSTFILEALNETKSILTLDYEYSESSKKFVWFIGSSLLKKSSIQGFVWFFAILSDYKSISDYYTDSSTNCWFNDMLCSKPCYPAFKYKGDSYCIDGSMNISTNAYGEHCIGYCHNSCKDDICLDCNCKFESCTIIDKNINCICPEGSNTYWDDKDGKCKSFECPDLCKRCSSLGVCYECSSDLMELVDNKCYCKDDYLLDGEECKFADCTKLCNKCFFDKCIDCNDENSSPISNTCECNIEYYLKNGVCTKCGNLCSRCNDEKCEMCFDKNMHIKNKNCECNSGYYLEGKKCLPYSCGSLCLKCDSRVCLECVNEHMHSINTHCKCDNGYYLNETTCYEKTCGSLCSNCKLGVCEECIDQNMYAINDNCKCKTGYYLNETKCLPEPCGSLCYYCNLGECYNCIDKNMHIISNDCECNDRFYLDKTSCFPCTSNCIKCNSQGCEICDSEKGYNLVDSKCVCPAGFIDSNGCYSGAFSVVISITSANQISLSFSEMLLSNLNVEDVQIIIANASYYIENITSTDNQTFVITVDADFTKVNAANVEIKFLRAIKSASGSLLIVSSDIKVKNSIAKANKYSQTNNEKVASSAKAISRAFIAISISAGLLTGLSCLWTLMNTLQIISLMPLNSIDYPPTTIQFLTSFGNINLVPNILVFIFGSGNDATAYLESRRYGFQTSIILINSATYIISLIISMILVPCFYFGSKSQYTSISKKCSERLADYRYNYFIRFWIQGYLDLVALSFIQLKSKFVFETLWIIGAIASVGILVLAFSTVPIFIYWTNFNLNKIITGDEQFLNRWGSFYEEFKNNRKFWSTQFYTIFFIRRMMFALTQAFLNSNLELQASMNIAGSVFQLAYVIFYMPQKERKLFYSEIIGEVCTIEVMFVSTLFLSYTDDASRNVFETIIIVSVLATMVIQIGISIYSAMDPLKNLIKSLKGRMKINSNASLSKFPTSAKIQPIKEDMIVTDLADNTNSSIIVGNEKN
ncbi:hypothetical protein SteCoe_14968 [Stentor coeruleus]|uniref:EGF-like domain-containing protein n=1 Tax=Stentor coeruleus TaxID=5963 RepID=A0A1R2C4N4_9CILI|nr:hypothetical protein SteCoe_14968 [Stentor coeruleus]